VSANPGPGGLQGSYTFGNRQPVNFQQVETLSALTGDLSVTKTDNQTSVVAGGPVAYTIVVSNAGPAAMTGVSVVDLFPPAVSGITFTSVATGGATGNTVTGTNNINDTVSLPAGSTITY